MLVNLTGMDGTTLTVNSEEVFSLVTIPAALLPSGVANGVKLTTEDGSVLAVQGTLAAVVTALTGLIAGVVRCTIDGATGAILVQAPAGAVASSVRNAAGDYTVTLTVPGIPSPNTLLSINDAADLRGVVSNASATQFDVLTFDAAGAAADASFALFISSYT